MPDLSSGWERIMTTYGMDGARIQDAQRISDQQAEIEQLKTNSERATALLEEAQALARVEQQTAYRMSERVTALATQNATLREALTARSWRHWIDSNDGCPWCRQMEVDQLGMRVGHRADCQRQAALADPSPIAEAAGAVLSAAVAWSEGSVVSPDAEKALDCAVADYHRAILRDGTPPEAGADGGAG